MINCKRTNKTYRYKGFEENKGKKRRILYNFGEY